MRIVIILFTLLLLLTISISCKKQDPQENLGILTEEFFRNQIPELQETRLLKKSDLPERQQQFFDDADGQLQLLADLNGNGVPEYIVTGVSEFGLKYKIKKPYFIAIFEKQQTQILRLFFHSSLQSHL